MAPAVSDRVEEEETRRTRPSNRVRRSLAEPPVSPLLPRDSQKKRKRKKSAASDEYWLANGILDEKIEQDKVKYLVDWASNAITGEDYPPSWEPSEYVRPALILAWEDSKIEPKNSPQPSEQQRSSGIESSTDSQPIRPRQRLKLIFRRSPPSSPPPSKKPRRVGTAETARFQLSQDASQAPDSQSEIKDSYEEASELGESKVRVEIPPVNPAFDRDKYKIVITSSQPSQSQYDSHSLPSEPQSTQAQSDPGPSAPKSQRSPSSEVAESSPFIWDEPYTDEEEIVPIVQDSQGLPGSSSYQPSQTPAIGEVLTEDTTDANTEAEIESTQSIKSVFRDSADSLGRSDREPEPTGYPRDNPLEKSFDPFSSGPNVNAESSSINRQNFGISVPEKQEQLQNSAKSYTVEPSTSQPHSSSERSVPVEYISQAQAKTLSKKVSNSYTQAQPSLFSRPHQGPDHRSSYQKHILGQNQSQLGSDSDLQFQTQLPFVSQAQEADENSDSLVESPQRQVENELDIQIQTQLFFESEQHRPIVCETGEHFGLPSQASLEKEGVQVASTFDNNVTDSLNSIQQKEKSGPSNITESTQSQTLAPESQQGQVSLLSGRIVSSSEIASQAAQVIPPSPEYSIEQDTRVSADASPHSYPLDQRDVSDEAVPSIEQNIVLPLEKLNPVSRSTSTSADIIMDLTVNNNTNEMAELLKRARMEASAAKMAEQEAARASTIPHTPPPPPPPAVNQMLPVRETVQELLVSDRAPSPKTSPDPGTSTKYLDFIPLGRNEYAVPLPMIGIVRRVYEQEIKNCRAQIASFLNGNVDLLQSNELYSMIDRLKMICDHQDLIEQDTDTQQAVSDRNRARWAENVSSKCLFLVDFLHALRSYNTPIHIAVLVRPGKMTEIMEAILRQYGYSYDHPGQASHRSADAQSSVDVTLLLEGIDEHELVVKPVSLVLAFGSTFKSAQLPRHIRDHSTILNEVPLVRLVVVNSIEHLDMCIDKNMDSIDRLAIMLDALPQLKEQIGMLNSNSSPPGSAAKSLASFTAGETGGVWPLQEMPGIEGVEPFQEEPTIQPNSTSASDFQSILKRPLGTDGNLESSKRQRMATIAGEISGPEFQSKRSILERMDKTHHSASPLDTSSVQGTFSSNNKLDPLAVESKPILSRTNSFHEQNGQVASLVAEITELQNQLRSKDDQIKSKDEQLQSKEAVNAELRDFIKRIEAKCEDYEKSIRHIQPKYKEALDERGSFERKMAESIAREREIQQKLERQEADKAKLREENAKLHEDKSVLKSELLAATTTISGSTTPDVAKLQKLREKITTLEAEKGSLEQRMNRLQNDMEFTRQNYQEASSKAAGLAGEVEEYKVQTAVLERKASESSVRIHEIQASSQIQQQLERIRELEAELAEAGREVERNASELKAFKNGRRPMRGTSVPPRSPRTGTNTMSPGSARPISRVMGVGSRGNSPAPGGPDFSGRTVFGEALFAPTAASSRWPNHLT